MKITFLGTRGEIERRTELHRRHSSLLVAHRGRRVTIDCGADWLGQIPRPSPDAMVLTHAHPDHVGGLRGGSPCPVYATDATWRAIERYDIAERAVVRSRVPVTIGGIVFEAFPLEHSLRAPAVGYRISAGKVTVFYAPDVVSIHAQRQGLAGIGLYVGDGASTVRPIVRRRNGALIGHASIRDQLDWCAGEGVTRAIFTHCGSEVVRGHQHAVARVAALGRERGVDAGIAYDGMEVTLR